MDNFSFKCYDIDEKEIPIPPGLPQSIIARLIELCNVKFDLREDELYNVKYPVLIGKEENLKEAKKYLNLITEAKLALRDIAKLARKFKVKAKIYTDDEDLKYILDILKNDIANKDYIEIVEEMPEGDKEVIEIGDKKVYVGL
ncbi:hypothetical protein [Methanocaldococcus fervens]|uniref:Uncharacterized protein n=1 Tax=Methanocaldococcus fervens (strain DSM 4213 / JCM 15782 / AG86) TaxID=573064 RepID=C7P6P1_METFA|nr:hypothetical protein [Methanocaldococcus fervens]ACV24223.1 hypothetical protein Mefer_0389 [Methanocaldococcus fervens AG86]